ncbi:MAG: hypothetical protein RBS38_11925 [Bacteroidales bacterium]|nr:hypothetical protein [Bacteroidales bacterium]
MAADFLSPIASETSQKSLSPISHKSHKPDTNNRQEQDRGVLLVHFTAITRA